MRVDRLGIGETEDLARFLLYRMSQEVRGKLIRERPVIYRKLLGLEADAEFGREIQEAVLRGREINGCKVETVRPARAE